MYNKEEKLSVLSEMIQLAKADGDFSENEYNFIKAVASQLGITKEELDSLLEQKVPRQSLHPESQRILQFHRLVLLMNIDQKVDPKELYEIREMGLFMGLRPEAIDTVLKEMYQYPNNMIPPEELLKIFKRFYN